MNDGDVTTTGTTTQPTPPVIQNAENDTVELRTKWMGIQQDNADMSESQVLTLILENPSWIVPKRGASGNKPRTTHLILSGEHGGVLSIPDRDHEMFMKAYCRDIANGIRHYFREEKTDVFPLAVDLDHKPKSPDEWWKKEHIYIWVRTFQTVLKKCYVTTSEKTEKDLFLCLVTFRDGDYIYHQDTANHGLLRKKDYKQGYRLSFPHLLVTCETAQTIRQCVIRELMSNGVDCRFMFRLAEHALIDESVCKQLDEMLDVSVYSTNGFRMIGSAKVVSSLCGKKKDSCRHCYKRFKFDTGAIYKFWTAVPGGDNGLENQQARKELSHFYNDIQQLIRACSVRMIPSKPETPGFQCAYDISTFLLATRHGAQSLSTEQKRAVVRTQRFIDPANKDDLPKYEAILKYFHETTFPDSFPFAKLTIQDIKSIHVNTSTQIITFTILMNIPFCAIKKANHATPKSYFVFHPKNGLRQKCQSETCKKQMDFFDMPRPSPELHHVFFPSDPTVTPLVIVQRKDLQATVNALRANEAECSTDKKLTTEQMLRNAASYFQPQNELPLAAQIGAMRKVNTILQDRLHAFTQFCRDVPHMNDGSMSSGRANPMFQDICDPSVLIKRHQEQQGTENHVFRAPGFRPRGGYQGGGGSGRGGSGRGAGRKRTRSPTE